MTQNRTKIAIIGRGHGAMSIATHLALQAPKTEIHVFGTGKSAAFHPDLHPAVLSNTPLGMTQPFDPNDLITTMQTFHQFCSGLDPKDCFSRKLYGDYIESQWQCLDRTMRLVFHDGENVTDAGFARGGWNIKGTTGAPYGPFDGVAVTIGAPLMNPLADLRGTPGFVDDPADHIAIKQELAAYGNNANVTILGFGPSALDAIGLLEALDHKGHITIMDPEPRTPWALDADYYLNRATQNPYSPSCLIPENIVLGMAGSDLIDLLDQEEHNARARDACPGIAYAGVPDLFQKWTLQFGATPTMISDMVPAFSTLQHETARRVGIATAPSRINLFQKLKKSRKLTFIRERAGTKTVPANSQIVINTLHYRRSIFDPAITRQQPLIQNLMNRGLIGQPHPDQGAYDPQPKARGLIFGFGPANPVYGVGAGAAAYKEKAEILLAHTNRVPQLQSYPAPR